MAPTGVTVRCARTPILGLEVMVKRFLAGSVMAPHVHEAAAMCVVLGGEMHEATDASESSYGAGNVIFKPSGVRHSNRFGPAGASILTIAMDDEVVDRLNAAGFPASDVFDSQARSVKYLSGCLISALRRRDGLQCDAVALQLLAAVTTDRTAANTGSPDWLWRIRAAIVRDTRGKFTIDRAARESGIESARIVEHLRRRYGLGFAAYTHQVKIEEALMILLARPHVTLASVAAQLGFYDQSHFTRVFKRIVGITPSAFRRSNIRAV
jgi:AraC family transcriptional regulator